MKAEGVQPTKRRRFAGDLQMCKSLHPTKALSTVQGFLLKNHGNRPCFQGFLQQNFSVHSFAPSLSWLFNGETSTLCKTKSQQLYNKHEQKPAKSSDSHLVHRVHIWTLWKAHVRIFWRNNVDLGTIPVRLKLLCPKDRDANSSILRLMNWPCLSQVLSGAPPKPGDRLPSFGSHFLRPTSH